MSSWREREARARGVLREVNDQIAELAKRWESGYEIPFVCECDEPGCAAQVHLSAAAYAELRTSPRRYLIAPNHEDPEVEVVVGQGHDHAIVETLAGTASMIPEETDPRRRARFDEALAVRSRGAR